MLVCARSQQSNAKQVISRLTGDSSESSRWLKYIYMYLCGLLDAALY